MRVFYNSTKGTVLFIQNSDLQVMLRRPYIWTDETVFANNIKPRDIY